VRTGSRGCATMGWSKAGYAVSVREFRRWLIEEDQLNSSQYQSPDKTVNSE